MSHIFFSSVGWQYDLYWKNILFIGRKSFSSKILTAQTTLMKKHPPVILVVISGRFMLFILFLFHWSIFPYKHRTYGLTCLALQEGGANTLRALFTFEKYETINYDVSWMRRYRRNIFMFLLLLAACTVSCFVPHPYVYTEPPTKSLRHLYYNATVTAATACCKAYNGDCTFVLVLCH